MNTSPRRITTSALLAAGLIAAAGAATGCMGPGSTTTAHKSAAKQRLDQLKSGNEYGMAHQAYLAGDLNKALEGVAKSIALNPEVAKSHVLRGRILIEQGVFDEALASLEMAEALDPSSTDALYYQGIIYERLAEREVALDKYLRAATIETDNAQFAVAVAEVMVDLGEVEGAYQFIVSISEKFEHTPGIRQTMGHLAMMLDRYEEAQDHFAHAQILAPDDMGVLEDLARCQIYNANYAEAEFSLSRLVEADGNEDRRDLKHMRARCLVATDRAMDARTILVELTGDDAGAADDQAWAMLGQVAYKLKDMKNVRRSAARLQAIAPERYEGFLFQALWQRSEGRQAAAIRSTTEALDRKPNDFSALVVRGLALYDLGKFDYAKKTFAYTQELYPDSATIKRAMAAVDRKIAADNGAVASAAPAGE